MHNESVDMSALDEVTAHLQDRREGVERRSGFRSPNHRPRSSHLVSEEGVGWYWEEGWKRRALLGWRSACVQTFLFQDEAGPCNFPAINKTVVARLDTSTIREPFFVLP